MAKTSPMKTCKCGQEYVQYSTLQNKCPKCLAEKAAERRRKAERKKHREAKEAIKTRSEWLDEAEAAVRRFARVNDRTNYLKEGKIPECISCGTNKADIQYAAGHYKTKGAFPELRLMPFVNIFLQCNRYCNSGLSGNINGNKTSRGYKQGLIDRFGEWGVELIEYLEGPHPQRKYTIVDLKEIKTGFNQWARELEKELE